MRIGVDVGGTNTDAVLMDGASILASVKTPTTANVGDGIVSAISTVISCAVVVAGDINLVSIGTTHFTNAFVQRRHLDRVGSLRIALPASAALPTLVDWPEDLASVVGLEHIMIRGGYQYDGRINSELDEEAVIAAARRFRDLGITSIAVTGIFAPVNDTMERRTLELITHNHPASTVTLSSDIGRIGLLERENAAIMNASLATLARKTVEGFRSALQQLGITAPFFISQNDGTLMNAEFVEKYPVLTFASGPTNSMRGAAYLSGLKDAIVADIGGTTTDIGVLTGGFPRESSLMVDIGGVRTNFRMPDILALGLGGGSIVRFEGNEAIIGPQSVGYEITSRAHVFGGDTLTATDIAVAAGYADIGDESKVSHLHPGQVSAAVAKIHAMVEEGIDRMKTSREDVPLILVGGGSVLINRDLRGVSSVYRSEHAGVANAMGASIVLVSGEVDKVYSYETVGRDGAIAEATMQARVQAVEAGAIETTLEVADIEELPLAYMPGGAVRLRVKVIGELSIAGGK
jgi:N-methylhydantoinase A/oxoprolinase/acetone carboxylase beta subunit